MTRLQLLSHYRPLNLTSHMATIFIRFVLYVLLKLNIYAMTPDLNRF